MATKSYFDGTVLRTVEVPDRPLPVDVRGDTSVHALLAETAEKPADASLAPAFRASATISRAPAT